MARTLIIDDDPLFCDLLSNMSRELGNEPLTAGSLQEGLAKKKQGPFEVVLLDVNLPDGNGLDYYPGNPIAGRGNRKLSS